MFLFKKEDIEDTRGVTTCKKNVGRTIILECYWLCFLLQMTSLPVIRANEKEIMEHRQITGSFSSGTLCD